MFDESFTKLEINEIASILDVLNKKIEGSVFDPLETTILAISPPFYPNYRFLSISDYATNPPLQRFVFQKNDPQDFIIIDWTYKTIYSLNEDSPILLNDKNIFEYVRFFFSYVKGRHGRFIICESVDNIQWKDEPPKYIKEKINEILHPLRIEKKHKNGNYEIKALMMLKDALFNVDISVEQNGRVVMSNHEIVMEDIPVLDQSFGA